MVYRFFLVLFFVMAGLTGISQWAPDRISYQAVLRDNFGNEISDQTVTIEFSIHRNSSTGIIVFEEYHDLVQTNEYGLFSLMIGTGVPTGNGQFSSMTLVPWEADNYFLEVRAAVPGQGNPQVIGVSQMLSVPYSFYASTAGSVLNESDGDTQNELIDNFSLEGNILTITENNDDYSVDLSAFAADDDADAANELITDFVLNENNELIITEGGQTVSLSMDEAIHSSWQESDGVIFNTTDNVGVGTDIPTSTLTVQGSAAFGVTMLTGENYDLTSNATNAHTMIFICDVSSQDVTIGLVPAESCPGRMYKFRKMFNGIITSNDVTIVPTLGQTIDGLPLYEMTNIYAEYAAIVSNGVSWFVIEHSQE